MLLKVVIITVLVLALLAFALLLRRTWEDGSSIGFRDAVADPDRFGIEMEARNRERLAVQSENLGDDELRQCVADLLDPKKARLARLRLERHGARSVPFLVAALRDDRFQVFPEHLSGPFGVVCDLLRPHVSADMVPELKPLIAHPERRVRMHAALLLGKIGNEAAVEALRAALDDEYDFVRSYAVNGIREGIREERASRAFLDAIFEPMVRLLDRPTNDTSLSAPRVLLQIDPERAIAVMLEPRFLRADNPNLAGLLKALNDSRIAVPADRLTALLGDLEPLEGKPRHARACGQALVALAASDPGNAGPRIRKGLEAENETLRRIATEAFALLNGLRDVHDRVFDLFEKAGHEIERLPEPVQHYLRVRFLVDEVNNGGYSQYFFNSSADEAPKTPAALRAIGAEREAAALEKAFGLFGKGGPSPDRGLRQKQLARLAKSSDEDLDDVEEKFPELPRDVEKLLLLYAIANKDAFR